MFSTAIESNVNSITIPCSREQIFLMSIKIFKINNYLVTVSIASMKTNEQLGRT